MVWLKAVAAIPLGSGEAVKRLAGKFCLAKDKAFQQAALAFDAAAKSGDMAAINARFGELGKTCKACHDPYRSEMHH